MPEPLARPRAGLGSTCSTAAWRRKAFYNDRDHAAFEKVMESTLDIIPMRAGEER